MSCNAQPKFGLGIRETDIALSFPTTTTVGTTNPDRCPKRVAGTTVTYAATGVYTVVIPATYTAGLPYAVEATPQCDVFTDWFEVIVVGEVTQSGGNMTIVLQTHRNGVANAPAAAAGSRINLQIVGSDSGGK